MPIVFVAITGRKMTHCSQVTIFKSIFPYLSSVRRSVVSVSTSLSSFLGCYWITQVRNTSHSRIVLNDPQSRVFLHGHMSENRHSFLLRRVRTAARGMSKTELKQRHVDQENTWNAGLCTWNRKIPSMADMSIKLSCGLRGYHEYCSLWIPMLNKFSVQRKKVATNTTTTLSLL